MKSQIALWKCVADDLATWCDTCATMDKKTVHSRVESEGLSFLTITLPKFGKDFERSLDQGWVDRNLFHGFSWKEGLPRFLSGFLDRIFDRQSGVLADVPCILSIQAVRQLTLLYSKYQAECTPERKINAYQEYISTDRNIRNTKGQRRHLSTDSRISESYREVCDALYGDLRQGCGRIVYNHEGSPRHGPGKTADHLTGNSKWVQSVWPARLNTWFPSEVYLLPNMNFSDELNHVEYCPPELEQPVRVVQVPKTMKTPRIIAIEPTAMQYCQQALLSMIRDHVLEDPILSHMLGLDDQTPNQRMAKKGSSDGTLATLDLSEASDRVSISHVYQLLTPRRSHDLTFNEAAVSDPPTNMDTLYELALREAVFCCRSTHASVPGEPLIELNKFASMGSALTFPLEGMVFLAIILAAISQDLERPLRYSDMLKYRSSVRVFGDDIIVPVEHVSTVIFALESFGLKVNHGKSFWTGKFRESCGKEYYDGEDVSIVRARTALPHNRRHDQEIISTSAFRNLCYYRGYWQVAKYIDEIMDKVLHGAYPMILDTSPVLGRFTLLPFYYSIGKRWDSGYQIPLVKGYRIISKPPSSSLDGFNALLKILVSKDLNGLPFDDEDHLRRAGRPRAVTIKRGWFRVF